MAYVTVPNKEVGKAIGLGLVKEKLAACVNIIPSVTSIYEWENEINEDEEVLIAMYFPIHCGSKGLLKQPFISLLDIHFVPITLIHC